jgi:hypothetical protein
MPWGCWFGIVFLVSMSLPWVDLCHVFVFVCPCVAVCIWFIVFRLAMAMPWVSIEMTPTALNGRLNPTQGEALGLRAGRMGTQLA